MHHNLLPTHPPTHPGGHAGSYDLYLFKLYTCLGVLGAAMAALLALWAALNVLLCGAWAAQAWNLEKASKWGRWLDCMPCAAAGLGGRPSAQQQRPPSPPCPQGSAVAANSTIAWSGMSLEYSRAVDVLSGGAPMAGGVAQGTGAVSAATLESESVGRAGWLLSW